MKNTTSELFVEQIQSDHLHSCTFVNYEREPVCLIFWSFEPFIRRRVLSTLDLSFKIDALLYFALEYKCIFIHHNVHNDHDDDGVDHHCS